MSISQPLFGDILDPAWATEVKNALDSLQTQVTNLAELSAIKTADESVTSSTVLQNDDHLVLTPALTTDYWVDVGLFAQSNGSIIDLNVAFTFATSGATLSLGTVGPDVSIGAGTPVSTGIWQGSPGDTTSPTATFTFGTNNGIVFIMIRGVLHMGSTSGNLQLQFCQAASSATPVILKTDSWMRLRKK